MLSVKAEAQKLGREWMEEHGGIEAERKLINGVSDGGNDGTRI